MIIIGHKPRRISGAPKLADSAAIVMSQAAANPKPPPRAAPLTRAIVGLPQLLSARKRSARARRWPWLPTGSSMNPPRRSPPAENVPPAPVITITLTSGSAAASRTPSTNSAIVVVVIGLCFATSSIVRIALCATTSYRTTALPGTARRGYPYEEGHLVRGTNVAT